MKTIFLAAGSSSRMDPISDKNFLNFQGEPLLVKLLKNAYAGGLDNFIIIGNDQNLEQIKSIKENYSFLDNSIITTQPKDKPGINEAVKAGLEFVKDDESVVILGGNDMVDFNIYKELINTGLEFDGSILAKKTETYFPGGYLDINDDDFISEIIEKPTPGTEPSDFINIMAHCFRESLELKQALEDAKSSDDDVYEVALDHLFKTKKFKAIKYDNYWQAIKYPWHVLSMSELFMKNLDLEKLKKSGDYEKKDQNIFIHKTTEISDSATIKGQNIIIEAGVKIFENAVICGPCYIGKNTIIGNNVLIRDSNLENSCTIGYNSEIARSYLASNVSTHIAYIGDSIVDQNVNFGAYSCTANLRLDKKDVGVKIKGKLVDSQQQKLGAIIGKDCQIGVGAKIMPGIRIPVQKFVKPNEVFNG